MRQDPWSLPCRVTQHRNGTTTDSHPVVTPVIVAPGSPRGRPLEPEFNVPQDSPEKPDCKNAAAKRWLDQYGARYRALGVTILGDDLYCQQPRWEAIRRQALNFILVCKPDSHPTLYQWVAGLAATGEVPTLTVPRRQGQHTYTDSYRFVGQVPLRDGDDARKVNGCELTTTRRDGQVVSHNAFATHHALSAANVAAIVRAGRARWKVENESHNTLKTKAFMINGIELQVPDTS